jgi:hypothetical protein
MKMLNVLRRTVENEGRTVISGSEWFRGMREEERKRSQRPPSKPGVLGYPIGFNLSSGSAARSYSTVKFTERQRVVFPAESVAWTSRR